MRSKSAIYDSHGRDAMHSKELHEEHDRAETVTQRMGNHAWSQALAPQRQKRKQEPKHAHRDQSKQSLKIVALDEQQNLQS